MTTTNDITKLPKWARDEINNLRREVSELETQIKELVPALKGEQTLVTWHDLDTVGGAPTDATVQFTTPTGWIEASIREGKLRVHGQYSLGIMPSSTNALWLEVKR